MNNPIEIQISPGELIDRYSIILIKTAYIIDQNKIPSIDHEKNMLEPIYNELEYQHKEERLRQLIITNCIIWDYEEIIRHPPAFDLFNRRTVNAAKMIAKHIDTRYVIKRAINDEVNYKYLEEKSHF
jgi:hypothetical protein